jgi:hypothetical protein
VTVTDRDRLRRTLIKILSAHRDTAFRLPVLIERLTADIPDLTFSETDALENLAFLEGLEIVRKIKDALQGPPTWQITMLGVHYHELNP